MTRDRFGLPQIFAKHGNDELVHCFQAHGVEFLVVGRTAVAVHGARDPFQVDDFDVLVNPTLQNAESVMSALSAMRITPNFCHTDLANQIRKSL
jgi:hypothetical protein